MATDFNVEAGAKAPRKALMHFVKVDEEWEQLGRGVEDSSIETNFETETVNDILGNSETSINGASPSQTFDPFTVRGGSKLAFYLHEIWLNKEYEKLSQFEMLTVCGYVDNATGGFEAYTESDCTITFERIGGSAYVDMPITVNYSDKKVRGSVTVADGKPTFTPATAGIAE